MAYQELKDINERNVFEAYEGGFLAESFYFFVNKKNNNYEFRFGYARDGRLVDNDIFDPNIKIIVKQDEEYYKKFIDELLFEIKDWKEKYTDNDIDDGIQWSIKLIEQNKKYYGSNDFPKNYNKVYEILERYFHVNIFI